MLLGAAERVWATFGVCLFGSDHWLAERRRAVEQAQASLGETKYRAAHDAGLALDQAAAVAFGARRDEERPAGATAHDVVLTPREREIADLVAEGLSNRDISRRLVIAQRTAECHVENILTKFGFRSHAQIAAWVVEHRAAG